MAIFFKQLFLSILFFIPFLLSAQSNKSPISKHYNAKNNVAVEGYDVVSYFKGKEPEQGKKQFASMVDGITYYFANPQNAEAFKKSPVSFMPQFGGWCAYAMGNTGEKVEVDPETYKIIDGKLYLFYNKLFNNTLKSWNKMEASLKSKAHLNWQKLLKSN